MTGLQIALDPDSDLGSKNGELSLNENHAVFAAFVCWIWTGRLKDIPDSVEGATVSDFYLPHKLLYKIWVFGDMRGVPGLCNAAIDMLHEKSTARLRKWDTPEFFVPWIYANTAPDASLRNFKVGSCIFTSTLSFWQRLGKEEKGIPMQFILDALPIIVSRGPTAGLFRKAEWTTLGRCRWHDHSGPGGKLRT